MKLGKMTYADKGMNPLDCGSDLVNNWIWIKLNLNAGSRFGWVNPFEIKRTYNTTSNNTKLVHWPLTGGLLHLVQRGEDWVRPQPTQAPPRCTKCNNPPINGQCTNTVLLYNGPLLCGFHMPIKWLCKVQGVTCTWRSWRQLLVQSSSKCNQTRGHTIFGLRTVWVRYKIR